MAKGRIVEGTRGARVGEGAGAAAAQGQWQ